MLCAVSHFLNAGGAGQRPRKLYSALLIVRLPHERIICYDVISSGMI